MQKSKKKYKRLAPIDRDRIEIKKTRAAIKKYMAAALKTKMANIISQVIKARAKIGKVDEDTAKQIEDLIASLTLEWGDIAEQMGDYLKEVASDAVAEASIQIGFDREKALTLANDRAVAWAEERGAELVGKKWVDGELVDNPNAEWAISESTRDMIASDITTAMEEGMSNDELAALLEDNYAFSEDRAEMIARTETAVADIQGNMELYNEASENGIPILKQWITAEDDLVSEDCEMNGDSDPIELDELFPSGASEPPEHPNCRCDILPVIEE